MSDKITISKFGVFHTFPFSFDEIEFDEKLFSDIKKEHDIIDYLKTEIRSSNAEFQESNNPKNWCKDKSLYDDVNKRIYSPYYFSQEKNFRIFFKDIKLLKYLFCWDDISGKENGRLTGFIKKRYGIGWVETAIIEKIDSNGTINLSSKLSTKKENHISLKLNDNKTRVILLIDDIFKDEFIAKKQKNNEIINIYDVSSKARDIQINAIIDKRGFGIMNFFVEYRQNLDDDNIPLSPDEVLKELYLPHENQIIITDDGKEKRDFEEVYFYYYNKINNILIKNNPRLKNNDSEIHISELKLLYEPYAFTIVDDFIDKNKSTKNKSSELDEKAIIKNFLQVLLWEKEINKIQEYKDETKAHLYMEISPDKRYLTLLSRESTLLIDKDPERAVNNFDVIGYLVNIEMLILQKYILQSYDLKIDYNLRRLRNQEILPSEIIVFRERVQKDLEDLFDIRIKKYQRGIIILDKGRELLKLKDFYDEVMSKTRTLDEMILLKHNLKLERITMGLTLIGIAVAVIIPIVDYIEEPFYKKIFYFLYLLVIGLIISQLLWLDLIDFTMKLKASVISNVRGIYMSLRRW